MNLPKPQIVANWLVTEGSNPVYKKLDEVTAEILRKKIHTISEEQTWDYIEQYLDDIARELFRKETDSQIDAIELNFDISEEDDNYYIKFHDKPEIHFLRALQADSPDNFEKFCKTVLDKLGGKSIVTGGASDGGIDFISFDLQINNLPYPSTPGSRLIVIGQAKRNNDGNHIKETKLREFVGASIKKIDELKKSRSNTLGILHPAVLAFWTTTDFHEDAKKYARDIGIWYLNGIALCQLALKLDIDPPEQTESSVN